MLYIVLNYYKIKYLLKLFLILPERNTFNWRHQPAGAKTTLAYFIGPSFISFKNSPIGGRLKSADSTLVLATLLAYLEDISRLVTVTVEEDQINTPDCSPGAFIRQYQLSLRANVRQPAYKNLN